VQTKSGFPVQDSLPVLVMSKVKFFVSRYDLEHHNDTLVFSIPKGAMQALPKTGSMQVQYGQHAASRVWSMPDYDKSKLGQ